MVALSAPELPGSPGCALLGSLAIQADLKVTLVGAGVALGSPSEVELHPVLREARLVGSVWPRGGVGLWPSPGKGGEMLWELETPLGKSASEK